MNMISLEPNPPHWPDSVILVKETDDPLESLSRIIAHTQDGWNDEHKTFTCDHHFSTRRHAILFAPGTYDMSFQVGYYTQVLGLGKSADDVKFTTGPYVPALNKHLHQHGTSLDTFWRSAENFSTNSDMQWAVSQASPLRRVHVGGDLHLHDGAAYASGGHLANAVVDGRVFAGGQQQHFVRNVELKEGATGGAWSMVYCGCNGQVPEAFAGTETKPSVSVISEPRVRMEKPYIALKEDGKRFELRIPLATTEADQVKGPLLDGRLETVVDFEYVRVVNDSEPTWCIQQALDTGKHVILAPGIYELSETLHISHDNTVLLGLGLATLVAPNNGQPCIRIEPNISGVKVAGMMLEASQVVGKEEEGVHSSLFEWGIVNVSDPGDATNPGGMFDIFCRVGGSSTSLRGALSVDTMMRIHSGHVIGDNLWLWRADHAELATDEEANYLHISPIFWQTEKHEYRVETGLSVHGDNVTMFGLFVEHANGHQTEWYGDGGVVYFYQCEFPYCVDTSFGEEDFRGYIVNDAVKSHAVFAPGIYSNFRNDNVRVKTAIEMPIGEAFVCLNPFTVKLDNQGGIESVLNGKGGCTTATGEPVRLVERHSNETETNT